jgi:anti-sigma regulatory factor (Ser/Thr protein kinase)
MTCAELCIEATDVGLVRVLVVSGELTLADVPSMMTAVADALQSPPRVVVCDISKLREPVSDSLLTAFPAALRRAGGWPHACLHLAAPGPALNQAIRRMFLHRFVAVHSTVAEALSDAATEAEAVVRELVLPPDPTSLRTAREAVRQLLPQHSGPTAFQTDAALLVTTELVTNSIVHSGKPCELTLARGPSRLLVAVTDTSRSEPTLHPTQASAASGRGLHLVSGLSIDWGVRLVHWRGKTVWATLRADPPGRVRPAAS